MNEHVSIKRLVVGPDRADLVISSLYTYPDAQLECSFSSGGRQLFLFQSERFDLFEGEQVFSFFHGFPSLELSGMDLTVEVFDRHDVRQGLYSEYLKPESDGQSRALIQAGGSLSRMTQGGAVTVGIGGAAYRLHVHYDDVLTRYKKYAVEETPLRDFFVSLDEIDQEKAELTKVLKYPPSESNIEDLALRRQVTEAILENNCFQIHGAAIAVDNQGYIFTADSGTGKTTHIKLWLKNLESVVVVNGDQPIVGIGQEVRVYGSPWCGKEGLNTNTSVPLKAIVLMQRGNKNEVSEISMQKATIELLRQVYRPVNSVKMGKTLQLLAALEGKVRFYKYIFDNFAEDAFSVAYNAIHLGHSH